MSAISLFHGDNLTVMRKCIKDASIDLVYLDPPFNSNQNFRLLASHDKSGNRSNHDIAYNDHWKWDDEAAENFDRIVEADQPQLKDTLQGFKMLLGESDRLSYLVMMAPRLRELHRILKDSG